MSTETAAAAADRQPGAIRIERIGDATLYLGDVLAVLRTLSAESVHTAVTSPPYWGLRDYGVAGQIGLEESPAAYVEKMREVFAEVRRVLRSDGTCWVNLGDSYASRSSGDRKMGDSGNPKAGGAAEWRSRERPPVPGLKPKDLVGIPWRVAFALQADGWYLRSDIIWAKPNPMPESVTDRPTKAHEYLFLLAKSAHYFYDAEAIREAAEFGRRDHSEWVSGSENGDGHRSIHSVSGKHPETGRNRRTVWTVDDERALLEWMAENHPDVLQAFFAMQHERKDVWSIASQSFSGAHFATFPEKLIEPCVLAGCPAQTCPECGAPWERVVERTAVGDWRSTDRKADLQHGVKGGPSGTMPGYHPPTTLGFRPTCTCGRADSVPGVVLDPFGGAGTTAVVAAKHDRRSIEIELNPAYLWDIAAPRIRAAYAQPRLFPDSAPVAVQGELLAGGEGGS